MAIKVSIDAQFMRFNPSTLNFHESIRKDIPAFAEYEEHDKQTRTRIFAWIVCMYDMNTPLLKEVKDMYKRKVYAATLVGIAVSSVTGKYEEWAENMILGKDKKINSLVVQFIASFSSPEYMQLQAHVAMQHEIMNKIISGKADKNDQVMFDISIKTVKDITNLLYGSGERDEVLEARRALYQQVAMDLSDLRAENVAMRVANGDGLPSSWNPYEEGYEPGDIHFKGDDPSIADASEK